MTMRLLALALGVAGVIAAQQGKPTPSQLAWLNAHAIELETVQAETGFADLQKLKAAFAGARIVSLGEATHGTREVFQMKHRLIEFLASELGFTVVAFEANMPEAYRVNDYVLHGRGSPKALLDGMYFWTWNTEEVLALIEWMRRFNASGKGPIRFTGFDMQTVRVAAHIVDDFLRTADPSYADEVRGVLNDAESLMPPAKTFVVSGGTLPVTAATGRRIRLSGAIKTTAVEGYAALRWRADGVNGMLAFDMQAGAPRGTTDWTRYETAFDLPLDTVAVEFGVLMRGTGTAWFDDLRLEIGGKIYDAATLPDLGFEASEVKGIVTTSEEYVASSDHSTSFRGRRSLRIQSRPRQGISAAELSRGVERMVAHLDASRPAYLRGTDAPTIDWAIQNARIVQQYAKMVSGEMSRDESMARNVRWILETAPKGTRIALWAHNNHVGRHERGVRTMGTYLDDWYGPGHLVVGFALDSGEYRAVEPGTGLGRFPLASAQPGSYEYVFARSGISRFVVDLRSARPDDPASAWLRTPMQFRSIGAIAGDRQFHSANIGDIFDLVVFLRETTATRTLSDIH